MGIQTKYATLNLIEKKLFYFEENFLNELIDTQCVSIKPFQNFVPFSFI